MNCPENTPLFWNATAALRCRDHAPIVGSSAWLAGNWTPIARQDRQRIGRLNGRPAACDLCAVAGSADGQTDARAAYLASRVRVGRALVALAEHLDILDAGQDIAPGDWSFAGTFNAVARTIEELVPGKDGAD